MKLFYPSAISTLIGAVFASLTFRSMERSKREDAGTPPGRAGVWSLSLLVLLPVAALLMYYQITIEGWDDVPYVAGFLIFSVAGGVLAGGARFGDGVTRLLLATLADVYTMAILAALCLAPLQTPSLPLVHAGTGPGSEPSCSEATDNTFVKLNLEDDYWHLYNDSGLYAIPSSEMQQVRYVLREECPGLLDRN